MRYIRIAVWFFVIPAGVIAAVFMAFIFVYNYFGIGTDDTDLNGWNRSGLTVHTDYKTGIQYLSDGRGGLIRRAN